MSAIAIDSGPRVAALSERRSQTAVASQTLELSASRAYDRAVEALGAYKLTGNFVVDLEIVLKNLRVHDKVRYCIRPKTFLSDRRLVEFYAKDRVADLTFRDAVRRIRNEVGSEPPATIWTRIFR
jgi:hypothetical protein